MYELRERRILLEDPGRSTPTKGNTPHGDDKVIAFNTPENMDALQEVLKQGARKLLEQAIEAELADLLERHTNLVTADGKRAVVRNGYLPERTIQTGLGIFLSRSPKCGTEAKRRQIQQ